MSRNKEKTFTVYFHTNIDNNKVYVGITSQKITSRWGKNGRIKSAYGYKWKHTE